jgi:hypothetical protein
MSGMRSSSYQLSVSYEVSVVHIDLRAGAEG